MKYNLVELFPKYRCMIKFLISVEEGESVGVVCICVWRGEKKARENGSKSKQSVSQSVDLIGFTRGIGYWNNPGIFSRFSLRAVISIRNIWRETKFPNFHITLLKIYRNFQ